MAVAGGIALVVSVFSYWKWLVLTKGENHLVRYLPMLLRFCSVFIVALLFLAPVWYKWESKHSTPELYLVVDNSASIKNMGTDPQGLSRALREFEEKLSGTFIVKSILFDTSWRYAPLDSLTLGGTASAISRTLQHITDIAGKAHVVLITDGNNTLPPSTLPPLPANFWGVVVGDTSLRCDAAVERVVVPAVVGEGVPFEVEVWWSMNGRCGADGVCELHIWLDGKLIHKEKLKGDNPVRVLIRGVEGGTHRVQAKLNCKEIQEATTVNNSEETIIPVSEEKLKVAVGGMPHPDRGALVRALRQQPYLSVFELTDEIPPGTNACILIGWKMDFVKLVRSAPPNTCWLILLNSFTRTDSFLLEPFPSATRLATPVRTLPQVPTSFPIYQLVSRLPPLSRTYALNSPLSHILLTDREGTPLLACTPHQQAHLCVMVAEGLWQWRLHTYRLTGSQQAFDSWLTALLMNIMPPVGQTFVVPSRAEFAVTEPVTFEVVGAPPQDTILLQINANNKDNQLVRTISILPGQTLITAGTLPAGNYSHRAFLPGGVELHVGTFRVMPHSREVEFFAPNVSWLEFLFSRERLYTLDNLHELARHLRQQAHTVGTTLARKEYSLIDLWWLFFVVLVLLGAEWLVRKWVGIL